MAIDYELYDVKKSFRINEAAKLWCDIEQVTERNKKRYNIMRNAMVEAILMGDLECYLTDAEIDEYGDYYIPPYIDTYGRFVLREQLIAWATSLEQRPKFLFPEERNAPKKKKPKATGQSEPVQEVIIKKEIAPRPNQLLRARCEAVAGMLWDENINYTQKEIVAHPAMKKHGYQDGVFIERTLLLWVSKVDPRRKVDETTPEYEEEDA